MPKLHALLNEKFDLASERVLLTGAQAIVRLVLMQRAIDQQEGLNTAGYITGYRGSPLANLEAAFAMASDQTVKQDILFQPAINEDLAATAIWGTQQAELRGEGRFDGVFAIWYGKGPGVDRSGDALRHANHAGTSRHGGVLALMGDDHTCESSTSAHQSEFAFIDAMIPIFSPSNVQEIIDYGLLGYALSRYAGTWVGMKCVKDTAESTATIDGRLNRQAIRYPSEEEFQLPQGGLNIRTHDHPLEKELRLHTKKHDAILAFQRANNINCTIWSGGKAPKIGIITSGKSYTDTRQALADLKIDEHHAEQLGLALFKVAMPWPLEPIGILKFAEGKDCLLVIEEKRPIIEPRLKEILYDSAHRPHIVGKRNKDGEWLLPSTGGLDTLEIATAIAHTLIEHGEQPDNEINRALAVLNARKARRPTEAEPIFREAYFCAGCPHNRSTVVPEGARAYAGIGCHYMVQWMDRNTEGSTQMGAEGANWIGEALFSTRQHIFQNIGDGTYVHSGSLAIRAAIAAGTNITFKILYNDAVAMTGGQPLEGGKSVLQMAAETKAEGATAVAIVTDDIARYHNTSLPSGVELKHRNKLDDLQRRFEKLKGVTVIIYDQTCAAEKRRRRKRRTMPQPDTRVFINPLVCEGCGDCGQASNCVAILPLETEFGRKREIDQSACNFDMSCLDGFCPSFVTIKGAKPNSKTDANLIANLDNAVENIPEPKIPELNEPYAILAAGIGGTGVVTISAILGQAAHIDNKAFGAIDVTGLAQKGGAVICHMRIANSSDDIHAIHVGTESAELIIGGDLIVTASNKVLATAQPDRTALVISTHEIPTADITRDPDAQIPTHKLDERIKGRIAKAPCQTFNAHTLARRILGDSICANMILLGAAYQAGHIPLSSRAIETAIETNGAAAEKNRKAFRMGRLAIASPAKLQSCQTPLETTRAPQSKTLADRIDLRAQELTQYQNARLAERYRDMVEIVASAEKRAIGKTGALTEAVAKSYFKLLAIKDEYEVARLFTDGRFQDLLNQNFSEVRSLSFHFSPPSLRGQTHKSKRAHKLAMNRFWMMPVLKLLAAARRFRGSWADPFQFHPDRRLDRQLITDYEHQIDKILATLSPQTLPIAVELASLPQKMRGFGHVKQTAIKTVEERQKSLFRQLRAQQTDRKNSLTTLQETATG